VWNWSSIELQTEHGAIFCSHSGWQPVSLACAGLFHSCHGSVLWLGRNKSQKGMAFPKPPDRHPIKTRGRIVLCPSINSGLSFRFLPAIAVLTVSPERSGLDPEGSKAAIVLRSPANLWDDCISFLLVTRNYRQEPIFNLGCSDHWNRDNPDDYCQYIFSAAPLAASSRA